MEWGYMLKILAQILFYYTWSISITFFNKWCFSNFSFPLTVSFFHMTIVSHVIWFYRSYTKPTSERDAVTWSLFFKRVCPAALAASLDIALSNWSFMYITVSMYTMCKSSVIIFILVAAIVFKLEKPKLMSIVVVILIAIGLFLFTYQSTSFNLFGFILVMTASAISGLRWVLSQILLQRDSLGLTSTLEFVYHVEPVMALSILPLALGMEGSEMVLSTEFIMADQHQSLWVLFVVIAGAFLALMLTFSEYLLLSNTSSITISICGIVKEIAILVLASTVGGDKLSSINVVGLVVCLSGISLHVYMKYKNTQFGTKDPIEDIKGDPKNAAIQNSDNEHNDHAPLLQNEEERTSLLSSSSKSSFGEEISTRPG